VQEATFAAAGQAKHCIFYSHREQHLEEPVAARWRLRSNFRAKPARQSSADNGHTAAAQGQDAHHAVQHRPLGLPVGQGELAGITECSGGDVTAAAAAAAVVVSK
jgi:hypothetical protein